MNMQIAGIALLTGFAVSLFAVGQMWAACLLGNVRLPEAANLKTVAMLVTACAASLTIAIVFSITYLMQGHQIGTASFAASIGAVVTMVASLLLTAALCDLDSVPGGPDSLFG